MSKRTESNSYTIIFSIVLVVIVGALLTFVSQILNPQISQNQRFEKQQNILYAMGVNNNTEDSPNSVNFIPTNEVEESFNQHIVKQYVFQGGEIYEDDEAYLIELTAEDAQEKRDPNYQKRFPLYVGEKDGKTFYIFPMTGKGLWDAVWGHISLDENFIIQGIILDHASETPGLGANITDRYFMDDFTGEHIYDKDGNFASVTAVKGNGDPRNERKDDNRIDALAGATITINGVSAMLRKYLREYIPHVETLINQQQ